MVFIKFAGQFGFIDTPNLRSSHQQTTPSGSGIVLAVAIFIASLFTDLSIYQNYHFSILAVALIFILGISDDLKDLPARYKLYVITLAAALSSLDGIIIVDVGTYFGYTVPLLWLAIPFTVFCIMGFTNALNLIDGLDGLAGSVSIIILSFLLFIGYQNGDTLLVHACSIIIPALLAFLIFNWNPAKTFMGDSGSLTIGFTISILSIKALEYVNPIVVLYLVAFPIIDTLVIITRRKIYGVPIFSPDKNHAHHVLLNVFNGNVKKTVVFIGSVQLIYAFIGVMFVSELPQIFTLLFFIMNIVAWYFVLTNLCENHSKLLLRRKRKPS